MRNKGALLARLDRTERAAELTAAEKAAARSEERKRLIASWHPGGVTAAGLAAVPEAEMDLQIVVMSAEVVYRYELAHGPVKALRPAPDLTPERWSPTEAEFVGYCKGILTEGLSPEWKRPCGCLTETSMAPGQGSGQGRTI